MVGVPLLLLPLLLPLLLSLCQPREGTIFMRSRRAASCGSNQQPDLSSAPSSVAS